MLATCPNLCIDPTNMPRSGTWQSRIYVMGAHFLSNSSCSVLAFIRQTNVVAEPWDEQVLKGHANTTCLHNQMDAGEGKGTARCDKCKFTSHNKRQCLNDQG